MNNTKKYVGITGGPGGFDGYAGLVIGKTYTGEERDGRVHIKLPDGRPTSITVEEWQAWFK
jgi:hypothetical protein